MHESLGRARQGVLRAGLLALGLLQASAGCTCVPPEKTWVQALELGFRDPAGTFAVFRTAFSAGASELEYRCLSREYLAELGIEGQLVFREFRDKLLEREPNLPWLLAHAEIEHVDRLGEREAVVLARAFGRTVRVSLVRVDFWEIRSESGVLDGDYLEDATEVMALAEDGSSEPRLLAALPLGSAEDGRATRALEVGWEWKIRGMVIEGTAPAP